MEIIISVFLLFVGIAILVIIHICIVGRAYRREFGIDGVPIIKGAGMPVDDLKKLPCFVYTQEDKDSALAAAAEANESTTNDSTNDDTTNDDSNDNANDSNKKGAIFDCSVCLESFKVGDTCRMLPNCHHYFHAHCIDVWLSKTPFCPICRSCTIIFAGKLPSPKVGTDGGEAALAGVVSNNPNIVPINPAAEELC